jgi:hypothetical protein
LANEMMRPDPPSSLASDYDAFLFAPIGEDGNGMPLSVLSALARQDVDPWREAAQLALLPGVQATQRLSLRIEALPGRSSAIVDPAALAARLLKLLPSGTASPQPKRPVSNVWIALCVAVMAVVMCAEYMLANHGMPAGGSVTSPSPPLSDPPSTEKKP